MAEGRPFFSVVIPAYNAAEFVRLTLDSVGSQTFRDYEIIVIDDGSVDGTSTVVREWIAAHPDAAVKLRQQDNKGIGAARNAGLREASGDFVAFLDADDLWMPKKLEMMAGLLSKPNAPDVICHDQRLEGIGRMPRRLTHGPYTTYRDFLFKGNTLSTSATVVRRKKLLKVSGFSEDLRFNSAEDYDLWLRLAKSGCQIEYLHEVLGIFRRDGQGITTRKIEMHCENCLRVLQNHFQDWPAKTTYYRYLYRRRRAAMLRGACREFLYRGQQRDARRLWCKALVAEPLSVKTWALGAACLRPGKPDIYGLSDSRRESVGSDRVA